MTNQTSIRKAARPDVINLLLTRRSLVAGRLAEPGPTPAELDTILRCAIRVPDHGKLAPWRIQVVQGEARQRMGKIWGDIFRHRNPQASAELIALEYNRPCRAPLLLVVSTRIESDRIPRWEQVLSGAALCQNVVIAANALGYFAQWVTEWVAYDPDVKAALGIAPGDDILGYIYIGSGQETPAERVRPSLEEVVSYW
jgi:nitroreductase